MAKIELSRLREQSRKIDPKLRMIANGDEPVNRVRAEFSGSIGVKSAAQVRRFAPVRTAEVVPMTRSELPRAGKPKTLKQIASGIVADVFVSLNDEARAQPLPGETIRKGNLVAATVPLSQVRTLAARSDVAHVELGQPLKMPETIVGDRSRRAPSSTSRRVDGARHHQGGRDVLIGIIDVGGFDFSHPDFLDAQGKTRWVRIWDQGGGARPRPSTTAPFDYGAEFRKEHLDAAIKAAPTLHIPPYEIERQSQVSPSSHGTHVASIAAGNSGVCPAAPIAGVLIALTERDVDRRSSFYDSVRVAHAVEYLLQTAQDLKLSAVSINISLGTNGHAHDGSSAINRWVDAALATPGRSVCVAAGNAGQEGPAAEGDIGYVMGRIHTSGRVAAAGLDRDLEWVVVGNGVADVSENELEIWYSAQDRFAASVRPPDSSTWLGPVEPGEFLENQQLPDGSFLSVYNELYHPANGSNYLAVYLSPLLSERGIVGVGAGTWTVRIHGREIRDGRFHGWIERDDPRRLGPVGEREAWRFPSFFSTRSNVDDSSVSSLGCGERILCAANLDEARARINITSSQGPTRDGRSKPDTAAPGTDIIAANGFDPDEPWVAMSGTSMASPYVAGVAGLMLAVDPTLTAAQIRGILHRTARPLPGVDFAWRNDAGFGVIDANACVAEAARVNLRKDLTQ